MLPDITPEATSPPLSVLLQTVVAAPWVVTLFCQKGEAHIATGKPCQDAYAIAQAGDALLLCVADGVGSCPSSHEGAQLAVAAVVRHLSGQLALPSPAVSMVDAIAAARARIHEVADTAGVSPFNYACTLTAAVITPEAIYGANLGDSSILILSDRDDPNDPLAISPLCSSAVNLNNEVDTLVHADWQDFVSTHTTPAELVRAIILATDGASAFFTIPSTGDEPTETFDNLFIKSLPEVFRTTPPHKLSSYFAQYLLMNGAVDDDDRTLILAYRSPTPNPERPVMLAPTEKHLVQPA